MQLCHDLFKYQVWLYGSETITYLNAILWAVTEPQRCESSDCPHPPLQAAFPLCVTT